MKLRALIVATLALAVLVVPANAEIYTIKLTNGTEFETQYRPKEVDWDESIVLVLTDVGNWIAIEKADIATVETETEQGGFGKVIDVHTIALGWAPNDAPLENPEAALDPMSRLLNFLSAEQANRPDYSVQQFVEPGAAGGNTGGLPVGGYTGTGDTAFPVGSGGTGSSQPEVIDN